MKNPTLWAPWRIEYIRAPKEGGCVFCRALQSDSDRENLVLHRGESVFLILNRFPYTAGHLMAVPNRHVAGFEELGPEEAREAWSLLGRAKAALDRAFHPQGYNLGLNQGPAAGAGVSDHVHFHLVPRWVGDTNFMPAVGEVKVISQHLTDMYDSLSPHLQGSGSKE